MSHRHNFFDVLAHLFGRSTKTRDDELDRLREEIAQLRKEVAERPIYYPPVVYPPVFVPYLSAPVSTGEWTAGDIVDITFGSTTAVQGVNDIRAVNSVSPTFRIVDDDDHFQEQHAKIG